jgi:hypothetical protein
VPPREIVAFPGPSVLDAEASKLTGRLTTGTSLVGAEREASHSERAASPSERAASWYEQSAGYCEPYAERGDGLAQLADRAAGPAEQGDVESREASAAGLEQTHIVGPQPHHRQGSGSFGLPFSGSRLDPLLNRIEVGARR